MKKQIIVIHGGDTFGTYKQYISSLRSFEIDFEKMVSKLDKRIFQK